MRFLQLCMLHIVLWILPLPAVCQNLVPNPGFEDYNQCPTGISGIAYSATYSYFPYVKSWICPVQNSSPDYLNACATPSSGVHVPEAQFGHQWAHGGNAYAGLNVWQGDYQNSAWTYDYREYLQCKLLQQLQAGQKYCVSFYVSTTISSLFPFNYVALDEIGINLSNTQTIQTASTILSLPYHMVNPKGQFLNDTVNWVKISGVFTASGGEQWLTLGAFNNTSGPPSYQLMYPSTPNTTLPYRSYMYIDDVGVYLIGPSDTTVTFHDSAFCNQNMLPMTLYSSGNDGTFFWNTGAGSKQITVNNTGRYSCIANADCHVYIDSFYVHYVPDKKLDLGHELVNCHNQPVTITPNNTFDVYQWSTGATTPTITVSVSGTYALTAANKCGTEHDSVHVYIQPPTAPPIVSDTIICQLTSNPKINIAGTNINWYNLATSVVGVPVQPQIVTRDVGRTTYYVSQTVGKCESDKVPISVDIKYKPRHILDDKAIMCMGNLEIMGKNPSNDLSYKWSTGQTSCCITPDHEGIFRVAMTSQYCGTYVDSIFVVFSLCDTCIAVPNAFSPNNDGRNDKFNVLVTCPVSDYLFTIFNRWGQKVFETNNPDEGWNGETKGLACDNGVYIYQIQYHSASTHLVKFLKGNITLFR